MKRIMLWVSLGLLVPTLALAVPVQIPYSGQLSENGELVNGTRYFEFRIFETPAGGTVLYAQAESLVVTRGVYHTELNAPDSIWNGQERWLSVTVSSGAELNPRTRIGAVPYAVRAGVAETLFNAPTLPGANWAEPDVAVTTTADVWTEVATISINAPADGYIWFTSSNLLENSGSPIGTWFCGRFTVTEGSEVPFKTVALGQGINDPPIAFPVSISRVLPVSNGMRTMHLWVRRCSTSDIRVRTYAIQALWFPNRYQ